MPRAEFDLGCRGYVGFGVRFGGLAEIDLWWVAKLIFEKIEIKKKIIARFSIWMGHGSTFW